MPPDTETEPAIYCPNCGTGYRGNYCPHCGQDARLKVPTVGKLLRELVEKSLGIDGVEGRLVLTLRQLFRHPGAMTADYLDGRRQRYISPLKLYLVVSLLFFVGLMQVPGIRIAIGPFGVEVLTEASAVSSISARSGSAALDARIAAFAALPAETRQRELRDGLVRHAPKAMLLLVPAFAALLLALYPARHYGEHLLFALHFHSFAFLALLPGLVPWPGPLHELVNDAIDLVLAVYLFLALRRVYGGGTPATVLRVALVFGFYALAIAIATFAGAALALRA